MRRRIIVGCVMAASVLWLGTGPAAAQVFGTFPWQMQPYCNRVTLTLTSVTGNFTLDGSDDQCGAPTKASALGIGVFNPDGTVGLNFTIVASPSGRAVHVSAIVSPANGQGTWTDDAGNSGTFAFFGNTAGLPVRPVATPLAAAGQVFAGHVTARFTPGFSDFELAAVSFPQPLPASVAGPILEYVASGTTATCPGQGQSTAGRLCVYNFNSSNISTVDLSAGSAGTPRRFGASLVPRAANPANPGYLIATWAYRVP
jgi:hypothetical protein